MTNILDRYGEFVGKHPLMVLIACLVIFLLCMIGSGLVSQTVIDYSDQIPGDLESIQAFEFIGDEFGSTGSNVIYVVEIDPDYRDSAEIRDVRDPEMMAYLDILAKKARTLDPVTEARSAADLLKYANGGRMPQSREGIIEIIDSSEEMFSQFASPYSLYISPDYSIAAVRINYNTVGDYESEDIVSELLQIADETSPPKGAKTTLTGEPVTNVVIMEQIGPTFAITGMMSFIGIFIVVVLIFYSLRYGVTSLLAVIFGSTWAFGFLGFTGFALNPNTSGALSLILGIGIDFGIQVVTRFRQELRRVQARTAIARTMPRVILPMTISVIAIILGFKAMSLGNLQFVGELGDIMALGVFMSYLAAITVVPAALVILNTVKLKKFGRGK